MGIWTALVPVVSNVVLKILAYFLIVQTCLVAMGTWEGHISPGVAFYSFGIVFCFQLSKKYLSKRRISERPSKSSKSSLGVVVNRIKNFPLDSFMKILYGFGAAMAELFYPPGTNKLYMVYANGKWAHLNEWQHFTMYMSFAASGVIDIVSQKVLKKRMIELEKAAVALAFYVTALLLFYHKGHGKHEIELEAHELLLYANLGMCFVLTLEMWRPFDLRLEWAHTLLVMQMGSWLFNLAFILFPRSGKHWDPDDMNNQMVLPIFFCWHIFLNIGVLGVIFIFQYFWIKLRRRSSRYENLNDSEMTCCQGEDSEKSEDDSTYHVSQWKASSQKTSESSPFLAEVDTTYA